MKCRWFMMVEVPELPGVQQCKDCGLYQYLDGTVIPPATAELLLAIEREEFCDHSVQEPHIGNYPLALAWGPDPPF